MSSQYKQLLSEILAGGEERKDRTGTGTKSIFNYPHNLVFDLSKGFPQLTLRKIGFKFIVNEMLWFLSGSTNTKDLDAKIWDQWALEEDATRQVSISDADRFELYVKKYNLNYAEELKHFNSLSKRKGNSILARCEIPMSKEVVTHPKGSLGPMYGTMYRNYPTTGIAVDQIQVMLDQLRNNPTSRRIILNNWHPGLLPDESKSPRDNVREGRQALAPCHTLFQVYVSNLDNPDGSRPKLHGHLYARSQDVILGTPANISEYALLVHLLAREVGFDVGTYAHTFGDAHVYLFPSHIEAAREMLHRKPKQPPTLKIDSDKTMFGLTSDDIMLEGYDAHEAITGLNVAV